MAKNERKEHTKKEEKLRQVMQKVAYQQKVISRGNPHGARVLKKKMHSLKAQEKKLDAMEFTDIPDVEEAINFFFEDCYILRNKVILQLNLPLLRVGEKILAKNVVLDIVGPKHLCIIGNNGIGKTTLMQEIYNSLKDRKDIQLGYMPQDYNSVFLDTLYVLDFLVGNENVDEQTRARLLLGNMKFTKEEMIGKIQYLSNGSKAKLILAKLIMENCNVLLLDEPTRNVSPLSNPIIRSVLKDFKGTIISISHDRKYIEEVIDSVYVLTENGLVKEK